MTIAPVETGTRSILILEDEAALSNLLTVVLEARGWRCIRPDNSTDAIGADTFSGLDLDVALLDLNAGDSNGLTVAEDLRRSNPGLPVVLMTGDADSDLVDRVASLGNAAILQKPFGIASLERLLAVLIAA